MYFPYFVIISPWKRAWNFICSNLNPLHPMMLCVKFGWNWLSGSGEEDENVKSLQMDGQKDGQMDRQTTDDRWSVKLTTASSLSELKRKFEIYILLDILIKNKDHNLKFISNQHSVTTPRPSKKAKISLKIDTILLKSGNYFSTKSLNFSETGTPTLMHCSNESESWIQDYLLWRLI